MLKAKPSLPYPAVVLSEEHYNSLEASLKTLQLLEQLTDECHPNINTIPKDLVSAALGMVTEKLSVIFESAKITF